jgi:hypothetical protein
MFGICRDSIQVTLVTGINIFIYQKFSTIAVKNYW